jgi:peptidoglycan hydrolase-like protein with peptidoglycan-binding domain
MRHNHNISRRTAGIRYYGGNRLRILQLLFRLAIFELGYSTSWGSYPYSYAGGYPYGGYNNSYSYHTPTYGYNSSMVAAVQRCLGGPSYYHGVADGVIGPQTRGAIANFESRNGMVVGGTISRPPLDTLGLA